jgi:GxxExxY protein
MTDTITEQIIGAAIEVHRTLGPGLLESIYEEALCIEFEHRQIPYQRQVELVMNYRGYQIQGQRIDMLVAGEVVLELRSVTKLPDVAMAQVLSYLRASNLQRGLLINFGMVRLIDGVKRVSLSEAASR